MHSDPACYLHLIWQAQTIILSCILSQKLFHHLPFKKIFPSLVHRRMLVLTWIITWIVFRSSSSCCACWTSGYMNLSWVFFFFPFWGIHFCNFVFDLKELLDPLIWLSSADWRRKKRLFLMKVSLERHVFQTKILVSYW